MTTARTSGVGVMRSLIAANAKSLLRDRMAIFWYMAFPILFIVLFGMIFGGSQTNDQTFTIGTVAPKSSPVSFMLNRSISSVSAFRLYTGTKAEELAALKKGDRSAVVIVPPDAKAQWDSGRTIQLPVYYDASQTQVSQVVLQSVSQLVSGVEQQLTGHAQRLVTVPRKVQPKKMTGIDFLLPGILGMTLMQLGLFGSMGVVQLRQDKVLKALGATPVPRSAFLASEIVVRMCVSLVQAAVLVAIGMALFHVHILGAWWAVSALVLLGALTFVSLGYALTCFARTVDSGQGLVQVVQFPLMFLSGVFWPVELLPKILKPIVTVSPLTYLGDGLRQVMVGYNAQHPLGLDVAVLLGWIVISTLVAARFWRWE